MVNNNLKNQTPEEATLVERVKAWTRKRLEPSALQPEKPSKVEFSLFGIRIVGERFFGVLAALVAIILIGGLFALQIFVSVWVSLHPS